VTLRSAGLAVVVGGLVGCSRPAGPPALLPLPEGKVFAQNPNLLPGGEIVVIAGSPNAPGAYATRVRFPAGFRVMPHQHPDERLYTVLDGEWSIGLGESFDTTRLVWRKAGEVYVLPANTPHFHYARAPVYFQVSGIGPSGSMYVRPDDDPRQVRGN
jgi:quercetin dioxygenase-like cupin family protein